MNIRAYQEADIEPFDGNVCWLDKMSAIIIINSIEENTTNKTIKFILFLSQFFLLSFF